MEERFMGIATGVIAAITITMCFLMLFVPNIHGIAVAYQDSKEYSTGRQSVLMLLKESEEELEEEPKKVVVDELKGHQIRLKLPTHVSGDAVSIENDPVTKTVVITINGIGKDYFDNDPMIGKSDSIADVTYDSENMVGVIELTLDKVAEVSLTAEDSYVYLDLLDPHDVYDYVVVVDAGHGGSVPGATKQGVSEKDIDLQIAMALKKDFDASDKNIGVYYTRQEDVNPSFASRVGLANDSNADLFISIHNNSTASGRMSNISGTEVMYKASDKSGESKRFAELCLNNLLESLGSKSKGTVVGDDIYIIRESKAPVALVEVGFMTNKAELENLCDSAYQKKTADAIYASAIEYLYGDK